MSLPYTGRWLAIYAGLALSLSLAAISPVSASNWSAWKPTNDPGVEYRYSYEGAYVGTIQFRRTTGGPMRIKYVLDCGGGPYSRHSGTTTISALGPSDGDTFGPCGIDGGPGEVRVEVLRQ